MKYAKVCPTPAHAVRNDVTSADVTESAMVSMTGLGAEQKFSVFLKKTAEAFSFGGGVNGLTLCTYLQAHKRDGA